MVLYITNDIKCNKTCDNLFKTGLYSCGWKYVSQVPIWYITSMTRLLFFITMSNCLMRVQRQERCEELFLNRNIRIAALNVYDRFDNYEKRASKIHRQGQEEDTKRWRKGRKGIVSGWWWMWWRRRGEWGGWGADRQAGGAIIAGFMYELLIESVVTSWVVNSGSESDREGNSLTREGRESEWGG